jgi:ABC-type Fe3+-citrate transport system substrate-binding protein
MNNEIKSLSNGDFEVVPLDDPAFLESQRKREDALARLAEFSEEMEKHRIADEKRIDEWWESLPYETRTDAFYAVVKRIHQAEIVENGSYRYALYDVFGFGPDMYARGMDCGYMALHNSIMSAEEFNESTKWMCEKE